MRVAEPELTAEEAAAVETMRRVLGTVLFSLAESEHEGHTLGEAILQLNAALKQEYGLENRDLLSVAAGEALRRMRAV